MTRKTFDYLGERGFFVVVGVAAGLERWVLVCTLLTFFYIGFVATRRRMQRDAVKEKAV